MTLTTLSRWFSKSREAPILNFPVESALTTDTKTLEGDARSSGESHISGGFGVVQKCVLPAVVRIDVGSIGKKLHRDVALEVRDTATDTHH